MPMDTPVEHMNSGELIDRTETGVRAAISLLFFLIARVAEAVLGVTIVFGLIYTLITQQQPSPAVKRFSRRVMAYLIEIVEYLTYRNDDAPFPFREFPADAD